MFASAEICLTSWMSCCLELPHRHAVLLERRMIRKSRRTGGGVCRQSGLSSGQCTPPIGIWHFAFTRRRQFHSNSTSTMSTAQVRLNNIKNSIVLTKSSAPMSQPIDNEVKGRLALVTGASGGYVKGFPSSLRQTLTHQILALVRPALATSGPMEPLLL